jgi:predicted amidohydrolase
MAVLRIALLQMAAVENDQQANLEKATDHCRRAASLGAHIALFPEMWNVGYSNGFDENRDNVQDHWRGQAVGADGAYVTHFRELARELNLAIAATYLERWDGPPRNTMSLIDRTGDIVLTYAKVHTCDFLPMETSCTPGEGFYVASLDTACGPVRVGAMICYDREHPESARILMLQGAEVILVPNACGLEVLRLGQFRARAFENAVAVAMTNYARPQPHCNGHSIAYDAEANLLVEAGEGEGIYVAALDLDDLRQYREKTLWGNAFRRPHRYGRLTSMEAGAPFAPRRNGLGQRFDRGAR